jgi:hypothetical protein
MIDEPQYALGRRVLRVHPEATATALAEQHDLVAELFRDAELVIGALQRGRRSSRAMRTSAGHHMTQQFAGVVTCQAALFADASRRAQNADCASGRICAGR